MSPTVLDSVENLRNLGLANGSPAVLLILYKAPDANIIETVDAVKRLLPALQASIPTDIDIKVAMDRTTTIRSSLRAVEGTLALAVALVILVVFCSCVTGARRSCPRPQCPSRSSARSGRCICSTTVSTTSRSWR